jgi:hypothetical protein
MRIKISFVTGLGLGFVAGTRAGRGVYDRLVGASRAVAAQPAVRRGAASVQERATSSAKAAVHTVADSTRDASAAAGHRVHAVWTQAQAYRGNGHGDPDGNGGDSSLEAGKAAINGSAAVLGPDPASGPTSGPGAGDYSGA